MGKARRENVLRVLVHTVSVVKVYYGPTRLTGKGRVRISLPLLCRTFTKALEEVLRFGVMVFVG